MQITKREGRKKKVDEKKKKEKKEEKHRTGRFFYSIATPLIVGKTGRGANGRLLQEIWLSSIGTISNYRSKK